MQTAMSMQSTETPPAHRPDWSLIGDSAAGGTECAADGEDWPCTAWRLEHADWPHQGWRDEPGIPPLRRGRSRLQHDVDKRPAPVRQGGGAGRADGMPMPRCRNFPAFPSSRTPVSGMARPMAGLSQAGTSGVVTGAASACGARRWRGAQAAPCS